LHVLRLRAGASLRVFDGCGHEFDATLESVSGKTALARIGAAVTPPPESPLRIVLAFAPLGADLASLVIQKAVELGVGELWPLLTTHTEAAGRALVASGRLERLRRVAVAAAAQSGRAHVPDIRPLSFDELLSTPFSGQRLLCCERSVAGPFPTCPSPPTHVLVAVGPAGGWDDLEIERAAAAGFTLVTLGPRILRAETASLAAVCTVQLLWGDLSASPWEGASSPSSAPPKREDERTTTRPVRARRR
jgi:16S rRNA (uracil1498-N3)-methyltransferase